MAAEIVQIDTQNFTSQTYGGQDTNLISTFEVNTSLSSSSYIEYFVYDNNQNLLSTDYNFTQYTVLADGQSAGSNNTISQIIIDPEKSLINSGYDQGEYVTYFNFFNKQIGSELQQLYIVEISSDRTEIRLDSTSLTDLDIVEQANSLIQQRENSPYFLDFYLNFGDNQLAIANNIQLDNQDPTNPTILIKLYEALPEDFDINSTLWVVTLVEESVAYQVTFEDVPIIITDTVSLKGPNFNLDLKDKINNSTVSLNYTTLTTTALTSSQNQLKSLLEEKGLDINIDYTNFSDFTHFSSAQTRLENFYYKMSLLEDYSSSIYLINTQITGSTSSSSAVSGSIAVYESLTSNIITNFDDYEYYLYYTSGSWAWPKTTSQPPYKLAKTGSAIVNTWYDNIILSASNFDNLNQNNLYYSIPEYLRDDPANAPYQTFVEMVGQFYDNIWIYYKDVTQKYNADNRLEYGVSKDIVADAIRDFGIKLYQNNFSNDNLYTAFLGLTPQGGLFPFPNITGSLPTPSGFEYINTLISASNDYIPLDDVNKSLYKRIYHNLPYLLKAKGTLPGLRTLITSYGIPDTVLRINEFGGKDKINTNDWDDWENVFNYAFYNAPLEGNYIVTEWNLNPQWLSEDNVPSTMMFRFKLSDFTNFTSSILPTYLWTGDQNAQLQLRYTGSGYISGSYSGSIKDPYYQYAHLEFFPDVSNFPNNTASIYLPFGNEEWWSVMLTRRGSNFTLHAGNKIYEGGDNGTLLGFYASSSVTGNPSEYINNTLSSFLTPGNTGMYFQEIRYYNTPISSSIFKDFIMNPNSIEGNSLNSGPNELAFRASLGGELYTGSRSIHPKVTGSWATTSSFTTNSNILFGIPPTFAPNTEYFFLDQPVVGIKNAISDKIRVENSVIPSGNTLSPFRSLAQNTAASQSYTVNTNLLEVAFAPQDEINDDIISQIGFFNIGEYIGDPRQRSSSATSYPDLDRLRNEYFQKYTSNYDLNDYIRLIKYFDNSLFKMIKDFIPARTSLASGVVIKQTLLERNKYPQPQVDINSTIAYTTSGSSNNVPFTFQNLEVSGTVAPQWNDYQPGTVENFDGGAGGVFNTFNVVTNTSQSWYETISTVSGSVTVLHNTQDEFYDGEFSGSVLVVTTQSLAQAYPLENLSFDYTPVRYSTQNYGLDTSSSFAQTQFLNSLTLPNQGEILLLTPYRYYLTTGAGLTQVLGSAYIKIHKFDNNGVDNTIPLGQATQLLIKYSTFSSYSTMNILTINEYPTYYLYEVNNLGSNTVDDYILDYSVSASRTTPSFTLIPGNSRAISSLTESIDNLSYFDPATGIITFQNTPNVTINFSASLSLNSSGNANTSSLALIKNGDITDEFAGTTVAFSRFILNSGANTLVITGSFYPLVGDNYYLRLFNDSNPFDTSNTTFNSIQLRFTQSIAPSAKEFDSIIIEPYISTPNYYNSDYNPLINNVEDERLSSKYQDVDYSTGIYTPTNFSLLISGSAVKAAVQDSNYTSKRVTLPRYDGSKSTSQVLNQWTPGDEGTYGKLPTVESLKTMVAYCDWIGGWPPERENASAIHVQYLIKSDGTVIIPNTSENSLADIKGIFETGENLFITTKTISSGQPQQSKKVLRGGTRIEPVLYNQSGSMPGGSFVNTITLTDNNATGNVVSDFQAKLRPTSYTLNPVSSSAYGEICFNQILSTGSAASLSTTTLTGTTSYRYKVNSGVLSEGVSITLNPRLVITANGQTDQQVNKIAFQIVRLRGGNEIVLYSSNEYKWDYNFQYKTITHSLNIPFNSLSLNDEYFIKIRRSGNPDGIVSVEATAPPESPTFGVGSQFVINQSPTPNSSISITSNFWISSSGLATTLIQDQTSGSFGNNLLVTSASSALINYYNNPTVYQQDIANSGFNPIVTPWSIEYGDEFRFEGREDRVYQVKNAAVVNLNVLSSQIPFLVVELDKPVPTSGSVNFDQFLIRRYVDDASQILMEGFAPINSQGPYIVRPEYVAPELNKSVDQFILDLTQKGLIS
jgi:hypothetical protein